ncbi:hypothetical protein CP991_29745, partial [Escherichia coli]
RNSRYKKAGWRDKSKTVTQGLPFWCLHPLLWERVGVRASARTVPAITAGIADTKKPGGEIKAKR